MKRIEKLPLRRAAATIAAKLSRYHDDEWGGWESTGHLKIFQAAR
jgi:hypothetical protein